MPAKPRKKVFIGFLMSEILIYTMKTFIWNAITFISNTKIILKLWEFQITSAYFLQFHFFVKKSTFASNNTKLRPSAQKLFF